MSWSHLKKSTFIRFSMAKRFGWNEGNKVTWHGPWRLYLTWLSSFWQFCEVLGWNVTFSVRNFHPNNQQHSVSVILEVFLRFFVICKYTCIPVYFCEYLLKYRHGEWPLFSYQLDKVPLAFVLVYRYSVNKLYIIVTRMLKPVYLRNSDLVQGSNSVTD